MLYIKHLNLKTLIITTLLLLNIGGFKHLHAQQFKLFRQDSKTVTSNTINSPITITKAHTLAIKQKDSTAIITQLIALSSAYRTELNFDEAFKSSGEALFLAEQFKDTLLLAKAHEEYGILNYLYKQDNNAGFHFKKAKLYFKSIYRQKGIPLSDLFSAYYNVSLYYQRSHNNDLLFKEIDSCQTIAKKANLPAVYNSFLNEKRASYFENNGNTIEANTVLQESVTALEKTRYESFLFIIYGRLGDNYRLMGKLDLAKSNYQKALTIRDSYGENIFYKAYIYSRLAEVLFKQQQFKSAYTNQVRSKNIYQTYLNPRNDSNQGFLTIKNNYIEQIRAKNKQLNAQELAISKQRQEALQYRILLFSFLFLSIIGLLIYRSRLKQKEHHKKEASSKMLLDSKNKELTTSTLQLIEKEKVIEALKNHINKSEPSPSTKVILKNIDKSSTNLWDNFNNRFINQNEGFYERLQEKVPDLSASDLKICALIKLNFTGKEMAYLLGISLGSVHVARHRLRKKMNLDRSINLSKFINTI